MVRKQCSREWKCSSDAALVMSHASHMMKRNSSMSASQLSPRNCRPLLHRLHVATSQGQELYPLRSTYSRRHGGSRKFLSCHAQAIVPGWGLTHNKGAQDTPTNPSKKRPRHCYHPDRKANHQDQWWTVGGFAQSDRRILIDWSDRPWEVTLRPSLAQPDSLVATSSTDSRERDAQSWSLSEKRWRRDI